MKVMNKTILFVDDDADDRDFMAEMVKNLDPPIEAVFVQNGLEAIEYLHHRKEESDLPCLIVLDLNMPFLDGKETYRRIRHELHLGDIPVIIFTSSMNPNDQTLFTSQGVEFYTKPDNFSYYRKIVGRIMDVCQGTE